MPAVAGENRCSRVPAMNVTATEVNESAVAQKRRGGKRRNRSRSKKNKLHCATRTCEFPICMVSREFQLIDLCQINLCVQESV
jgi:hypothetical protein